MGACPYLGLSDDATLMLSEASPAHRCHAVRPLKSPGEAFQASHCLVGEHVRCQYYMAAQGDPAQRRTAVETGRARARNQGSSRAVPAILGLLLLGLLVGAAVLGASARGRSLSASVLGLQQTEEQAAAPALDTVVGEATRALIASAAGVEPAAADTEMTAPTSDGNRTIDGSRDGEVEVTLPVPAGGAIAAAQQDATAIAEPTLRVTEQPTLPATLPPTLAPTEQPATRVPATAAPVSTPRPTAPPQVALAAAAAEAVAGTPAGAVDEYLLTPRQSEVGWWSNSGSVEGEVGDSFLWAGQQEGEALLSAVRFDLSRVPRGAALLDGQLRLVGLDDSRLAAEDGTLFRVQLIAESELETLAGADFLTIYGAPASITSLRDLPASELRAGAINQWSLDASTLAWLEQQVLNGARSITARISAVGQVGGNTLFAWDSGAGSSSAGKAPALLLMAGPPPPTPPAIPTRDYLVATFTPTPQNVNTAVAQQATATFVAESVGTYTPVPPFVTPTPLPANLATLEVNALLQGLPAVVLETPTPASDAELTAIAERATAVAMTTGTFTPVPTLFVTPFVVIPSPPAQNTATAAARLVEAEQVLAADLATPTPLAYNAIVGEWVEATPTPMNVVTAAAMAVAATAQAKVDGPATPTPFNWLVYTPSPTPLPPPPTWTPTVPPVIFESSFTPTPVPAATEFIPASIPAEYRNLIFFKRGMGQGAQTWVVNPVTGESGLVTRDWLYPMAQKQLPGSPDGRFLTFVRSNNDGMPEVYVRNVESGRETRITAFQEPSYDPTWSPTGEWIAFVSSNSGNDEIYRISPDGQVVEQLTFNNWEWDKHPTWSPDGSQIVFFSNRETGRPQLWIMNADGSNQRRLLTSEFDDLYPVWVR